MCAWQDDNAEVIVTKHDFNDEFGSGDAFSGYVKVEKEWYKYAVEQFGQKSKIDLVEMVSMNRKAWIPDIKDMKLACIKDVIQGFDIFHYCKAFFLLIGPKLIYKTGRVCKGKHQVPWNSISQDQSKFIRLYYLSHRFKLLEPSKLQKNEVVKLLEFWRARQNEDKMDIFAFHQWKNASDNEGEEGDEDEWGPRNEFKDPLMDNPSTDQSTHGARSRLDLPKRRSHLRRAKTF
ncbi:hypothetical protein F5I97DRAFT_1832634 [Phlebopus sp. FC_14]|nr:hypothetical protein F5I97DRAFT_1832634 [Phlebopus sp. FC_14]